VSGSAAIATIPTEYLHTKYAFLKNPALWVERALQWEDRVGGPLDTWQIAALNTNTDSLWNCTRQAGKSETAAAKAIHVSQFYPHSLILLVSASLRQSGELFRKVQDHYDACEGRLELVEDNKLSCSFVNGSRIVSLPGEEKTIRGFSKPRLIIEDEAARVDDAMYAALRPMLAISRSRGYGQILLMSTPFGKRGHFFEAWEKGGSAWQRTMIPWQDCPRITPEFIAAERASLGDWWVSQEYECQFVQTVDQVFSYDLIVDALVEDIPPLFVNGRPA
jgi:hypothetical protein